MAWHHGTTPEVLYPWKRDEKGTTCYNDPFARVWASWYINRISFYCEFELSSLNHLWVCPSHRLMIRAPRLFQTLACPWDRQPISHGRGPVGARPGVQCPIPTVDLNGLTSTVCHSGMPTICITDAELSNLDEAISKSNPRGGFARTVISWMVSPWARLKGSIISKDLDNLSIFMWDGEVVLIHLSKSKLADLDELISKGNANSRAYRPTPGIVVGPGSWVQGTIVPVNLSSLAIFVGHREVVVINGSPTPMAQLDEAITHGNRIAGGRMGWWCGCLADLIRRYRCHLPKTAVWRPVKKKNIHINLTTEVLLSQGTMGLRGLPVLWQPRSWEHEDPSKPGLFTASSWLARGSRVKWIKVFVGSKMT